MSARSDERVDGIMYCHRHDDFAIEGYDWSDECKSRHDGERGGCELTPMFTTPLCLTCRTPLTEHDPVIRAFPPRCRECF